MEQNVQELLTNKAIILGRQGGKPKGDPTKASDPAARRRQLEARLSELETQVQNLTAVVEKLVAASEGS